MYISFSQSGLEVHVSRSEVTIFEVNCFDLLFVEEERSDIYLEQTYFDFLHKIKVKN